MEKDGINIAELDPETIFRLGLSDLVDANDVPLPDRLISLGTVIKALQKLTIRDALWVINHVEFYLRGGESWLGIDKEDNIPLDFIINTVAKVFGVDADKLRYPGRKEEVVEARQTVYYLARIKCGYSLAEVGEAVGGRTPATVKHGFDTIAAQIRVDEILASKVKEAGSLL